VSFVDSSGVFIFLVLLVVYRLIRVGVGVVVGCVALFRVGGGAWCVGGWDSVSWYFVCEIRSRRLFVVIGNLFDLLWLVMCYLCIGAGILCVVCGVAVFVFVKACWC